MKRILIAVTFTCSFYASSATAIGEYNGGVYICGGTLKRGVDIYEKGYRNDVNGYSIKDGEKYYSFVRTRDFREKDVKLDKDCNPSKLKRFQ